MLHVLAETHTFFEKFTGPQREAHFFHLQRDLSKFLGDFPSDFVSTPKSIRRRAKIGHLANHHQFGVINLGFYDGLLTADPVAESLCRAYQVSGVCFLVLNLASFLVGPHQLLMPIQLNVSVHMTPASVSIVDYKLVL